MHRLNILFKKRFLSLAPKFYWGDDLDVRFYLLKNIRKLHNCKVLDIGCSVGMVLSEVPSDNKKFGIDASKESIEIAKQIEPSAIYTVSSISANSSHLNYKTSFFDVIILANVIEYMTMKDLRFLFKEIRRILKKGGKIYLTTPNGEHFYYTGGHKKKLHELEKLLKESGLHYKIYGYNPIPFPTKLVAWLPFIEDLLEACMSVSFLTNKSRYFYAEIEKP